MKMNTYFFLTWLLPFFINADDNYFIVRLNRCVKLTETIEKALYSLPHRTRMDNNTLFNTTDLPLFDAYPRLKKVLPRVVLSNLPTPVEYLDTFSKQFESNTHVYIKRDDLTNSVHEGKKRIGGNKLRKLEFLFGDALHHGAQSVITHGCIGSSHATATASCAEYVGLRCLLLLKPQPVSWVVRRNLLLMHDYGAQMIFAPTQEIRTMQTICSFIKRTYADVTMPYVIPTGGSNEIGTIGYVNAAFELKKQIDNGQLPMPDYIYVPTGSCGTASGLLIGAKAIGITSKFKIVAVEPDDTFGKQIRALANQTVQKLRSLDKTFPEIIITEDDFELVTDFTGTEYGASISEGDHATALLKETQAIQLDGTYSAKAFAAMAHDISSAQVNNKNILFWHTFCNGVEPKNSDPTRLPKAFHQFFHN